MAIKELKDQNFEKEIIGADKRVVVDFWAPWCGHCIKMQVVLGEVEKVLSGDDTQICGVNVDIHNNIAKRYNVKSIPTMLLFEDGIPVKRFVGSASKDEVLDWLNYT